MAMSVSTGGGEAPMCDVNTTPLIDVMLVMLVMLIITLPIQTHGVKLDMPRPTDAPPPEFQPRVIDIEIDYDGLIIWNGAPATLTQVESYFRQEAQLEPQAEIHIRPDRRSKYDVVANVMASAQRNKMVKMGFVNVAQFRE
ncbi:MAG: biopolymer transporter ExbD [Burkholderiales bacterium]|nr:MAG: biopolymer transporter ExbD [Burkholderiales bacterium]